MAVEFLIGAALLGFILGTVAGVHTTGVAAAIPMGILIMFLTGIEGVAAYFLTFLTGAFLTSR